MPFQLTAFDAIERTRVRDPILNAFVNTRLEGATRDAHQRQNESPRSTLHGIPYGLKDEWDTTILPTTAGSHRHWYRVPKKASPVYDVFNDAGAILIGKTNLSDLGMVPESTSFVGGATRNPHDLRLTSGGSSGGSAAAVADGMVAFDWGTDIGGSIRIPAAFCGVFGLKLSSSSWPVKGLFPKVPRILEFMLSQGPLTRTLTQMRTVLDVAAPRLRALKPAFEAQRAIIMTPEKLGDWPTCVGDLQRTIAPLFDGHVSQGHPTLPSTSRIQNTFIEYWSAHLEELLEADPELTSLPAAVRAVLSSVILRGRFGEKRFHPLTAEVLLAIAIGRITVYRDKRRAKQRVAAIQDAVRALWEQGTVLVAPVCVYMPPRIGTVNRYPRLLANTVLGNLTDATALTVPLGTFTGTQLPRALQIMGPPGSEEALLALGEQLVGR